MRALALFLAALLAACGTTTEEPPPTGKPEKAKPLRKPKPKSVTETIPGTKVSFDLVYIPGADVWMGKTEVTWDEYEAFSYSEEDEDAPDAVARPSPPYEPPDRGWGRGKRPAMSINRQAAERYCEWLSKLTGDRYRLPTETEWEIACRAGTNQKYNFKGGERMLDQHVWFADNSQETTQEVAQKKPNAFGLHDMLGNVWEYCAGPEGILRGGSFADPADGVTCDARRKVPEEWNERDPQRPRGIWWLTDGQYVGFRIARER